MLSGISRRPISIKGGVQLKAVTGALFGVFGSVGVACAEWTPLISAGDFTGINTDVGTVAAGIVGICLVIIGLGMLVRVLSRN